jgi:hypothetical protein
MAAFKKITISPESTNHCDNAENVAYLYRGYYIWKAGESGLFDAWNFAPAVYHTPKAALGETFEPYWDDDGDTESAATRSSCIKAIDRKFENGTAKFFAGYDPDAEKNVTITVSFNDARAILAALSRRCDELASLGGPQADELLAETKAIYQDIDRQAFHPQS